MRLLFLAVVVFGHVAIAAADQVDDMASRVIASEVLRLGGYEYRDARVVKRAGTSGNGQISFAVLYTIESIGGGNNYSQYLVAFLNAGGAATPMRPVLVGGKVYRSVQLDQVEARRIVLKTMNYTKADAACCPSLGGVSSYWLKDGELAEGPGLKFEP
jgi:hypothetical protein